MIMEFYEPDSNGIKELYNMILSDALLTIVYRYVTRHKEGFH